MDIGEETGNHYFESVSGQGPGGVFAAGAIPEIAAGHQDATPVSRVVQDKGGIRLAVRLETPVLEQVGAEEFLLPGGFFQVARRNDLVGIYVFQRQRHTGALDDVEFLFHSRVRGSVTTPVTAAAAAVSGLASRVREPGP